MNNYSLRQNEIILYQGNVNLDNRNGTVEIILTNLNLVFIITTRKLLAKSQVEVEAYPVEEIKLYNNVPQIKQKNARVEIFLTCGEIVADFYSMFEAGKFVNAAFNLLTGKTTAKRGADKFKEAVELVDDALGIDTVGTVKHVIENGITGTLLGGFGKKSASIIKHSSTAREIAGIAKGLTKTTTAVEEVPPAKCPSVSNDEQLETIKKMKELVDIGVLTQEEFEAKKKQLLGL